MHVPYTGPGATNSYIRAPGKVLPGPIPTSSFKVSKNVSITQCAAECSLEFHLNKVCCFTFALNIVKCRNMLAKFVETNKNRNNFKQAHKQQQKLTLPI